MKNFIAALIVAMTTLFVSPGAEAADYWAWGNGGTDFYVDSDATWKSGGELVVGCKSVDHHTGALQEEFTWRFPLGYGALFVVFKDGSRLMVRDNTAYSAVFHKAEEILQ